MICSHCGTENEAGRDVCERCGAPLDPMLVAEPVSPPVPASRLVRLGDEEGESFLLGNRAIIGRLDTCDIPIRERSVSREHALLSRVRDGYVVEDLGSTNGTQVNGRRIDEAVILRAGDVLTTGAVDFRFEQDTVRDEPLDGQSEAESRSASPAVAPAAASPSDAARSTLADAADQVPPGDDAPAAATPAEAAGSIIGVGVQADNGDGAPNQGLQTGEQGAAADRIAEHEPGGSSQLVEPGPMSSVISPVELPVNEAITEAVAMAERLRAVMQSIQSRLGEGEAAPFESGDGNRASEESERLRRSLRSALASAPPPTLSDQSTEALRTLLDSLVQNPHDITVLMDVAHHAGDLRRLIDDAVELQQVLGTVRTLAEG